jgi:outer membrane receptor protein involved in Fe transport
MAAVASLASLAVPAIAQQQDPTPTLREVTVIQRTPMPGFEAPLSLYPGHAQQATGAAIEAAGAPTLPDFLQRRIPSVTVNEVQGSPYQVDVNYRGHRLSPLLGSAQGLSLWLDGVRMNQPFGDTLAWDLLPEAAISGLSLVPGSNPLYGLNTLGGALVLTTKSGLTDPGTLLDVSAGSAGRKRIDLAHGRKWDGGWHAFVAGTGFEENGWRDRSDGRLANIYLKAGREQADVAWSLSYLDAYSHLTGNGLTPEGLLAPDRRAVYTASDITRSRDTLLSLQGNASAFGGRIEAQAYHRRGRRAGSNGDLSDDWADFIADCAETPAAAACTDPNDPGFVRQQAEVHSSTSTQRETGVGLQWSRSVAAHQWLVGADAAVARVAHDQFSQPGVFDAARNALVDEPGEAPEHEISLRGRSARIGLFASDVISVTPATQLTLSARWNYARVRNDLGQPAPLERETFSYRKLNPALGVTHVVRPGLTVFGSLSQGTRVPTSLELGCADAANPCTLPTGLQADPFLRQVVARTVEFGVRAEPRERVQVSAAVFRTTSQDDIVFLRSGVSQAGFFANVDRTRRQGFEATVQGRSARLDWSGNYSFLDATYRSDLVLPGPLSTAAQPDAVTRGSRIAGLPRHTLKFSVDWRAIPGLTLGVDWQAVASQVVAGNESGNRPELGRLPGYAVVHARASWQVTDALQLYLRVHNVFDRRYATFAAGNFDFFPGGVILQPGDAAAPARFVAPGAPRLGVIGLRYEWGR